MEYKVIFCKARDLEKELNAHAHHGWSIYNISVLIRSTNINPGLSQIMVTLNKEVADGRSG
jgi:hypothetical protein